MPRFLVRNSGSYSSELSQEEREASLPLEKEPHGKKMPNDGEPIPLFVENLSCYKRWASQKREIKLAPADKLQREVNKDNTS